MTLTKRLKEYWKNHSSKITSLEQLQEMISEQSAKACGEIVLKYAQKRLGKAHFLLAKTTPEYSQDLINCQAKLHAEIVADMYVILLRLCSCEAENSTLKSIMEKVHQDYVASVPQEYVVKPYLSSQHFEREAVKLGDLASSTGTKLFKILPAKSGLLPGNASIFQGQIRLAYISFLEKLGKKTDAKNLKLLLC